MAIRFKRKTRDNWHIEEIALDQIKNVCRGKPTRVMFPSTHDLTPGNMIPCMKAIRLMLNHGHRLLIVSKPHLECIEAISREYGSFRDKIMFRFTIGSDDDSVLKFWEPNAPSFHERLCSLELAYKAGFQTSISCEPMLDDHVERLVDVLLPFVTDAVWIGKMNQLRQRISINGDDENVSQRAEELIRSQSKERSISIYQALGNNRLVKWKESIKKDIGIEVPTEPGLDA